MKPVLFAIAACAIVFASACGTSSSGGTDDPGTGDKCEADSTYALIQEQIFERRGCTASA